MRKWKRRWTGGIIGGIVVVLISLTWIMIEMPWVTAKAGVVSSDGVYSIPGTSGSLGSSGNPFVVLEIVPNEKMAQFGYLVNGQEPIDLYKAMKSTQKDAVTAALADYMEISFTSDSYEKQEFDTMISDQDRENYYWNFNIYARQYGYYERLADTSGDYNITSTEKTVSVGGIDKKVYEYSITPATAGTGKYQWVGYTYTVSSGLSDTSTYLNTVTSDTELLTDSTQLKRINGYKDNIAVYNAYSGKKINKELFKKYALGLVYKDNDFSKGEDSSSYEFAGWYTEPQCVNAYNSASKVSSDITLYAKWKTVYSSGPASNEITFDANAGTDSVLYLPDNITFLDIGDTIIKPERIPLRKGYLFTGWYQDSACTTSFDFTKPITASATAYAGWTALTSTKYTISFNENKGAGNTDTITDLPTDITDVLQNGRTAAFTSIEPLTPPARSNYIFAGWYWNAACTNPFVFDKPIPSGVTTTTIQLYARWIPISSTTTYQITFNGNKPSKALSKVTDVPASLTGLTYGQTVTFPSKSPYLKGNIVEKLKNYHVSVITVTPKDFSDKPANLNLINRANLIVMNQTCTSEMQGFWTSFKNTDLFSKGDGKYTISATAFTENDLSWDATLRLMNKITGMNSTAMCPVIYDYSIYTNIAGSTGITTYRKSVSFTASFSGTGTFDSKSNLGYSSNVYKLYLMTQQLNPVTLYNAYLDGTTPKIDSTGKFTNITSTSTSDARLYWNQYTLLPFSVISSSDWNSTNNALEVIGIKRDYALPSSGKGLINNRVFLYKNNDSVSDNLVKGFTKQQLEVAKHTSLNSYFYPGGGTPAASYTTAQGLYYMLHNAGLYTNYDKSLNLLEIEPSDSFKDPSFWFWYISRYVPNFTGKCNVTKKNSSEFIGDISDLNSQYDAIYLGVDAALLDTDFMPNISFSAAINQEITIDTPQTIPVAYEKKSNTTSVTTHQVRNTSASGFTAGTGNGNVAVNFTLSGDKVTSSAITANLGADSAWLDDLYVYTTPGNNNSDYRYKIANRKYQYYNSIDVRSNKYSSVVTGFVKGGSGAFQIFDYDQWKWVSGYIVYKYFVKTETKPVDTWTPYAANTSVSAGDVIRFPSGYSYNWNFRYAHVGKQTTSKDTRRGSFDNVRDDIHQYLYSGNDLTEAKLNDLLDFAKAGYPVILSKDCFNTANTINTSIIDRASNVYRLLDALTTDASYVGSCFRETDTTRDNEFVRGLNNKTFRLLVLEKPVEYADRTAPGKGTYTDAQVYINGASDGSNSKINNKNLEFTIKVDADNKNYYEVKLYIDTNADGKFSETEEKLDSLEIENTLTHRTTRVNRLVGGQTYHIVRQIQDYTGAIPWKLELVDINKPLVRDDITGQCAIMTSTKERINVLQIISDSRPTVYFPTEEEISRARGKNSNREITDPAVNPDTYFDDSIRYVNSSNYIKLSLISDYNERLYYQKIIKNAGWFYYYTKILKEFEVVFYRKSVTEFSNFAASGNFLTQNSINMLILGYADCYSDITATAALDQIDDFISEGNTTLFTHDTTSFVNLSSKPAGFSDTYWGYNINQHYRVLLGMDRFGVMTNRGLASNLSGAPDKPYKVNTPQTSNSFYTYYTPTMNTRVLTQGMSNVTIGQDGARVEKAQKANDGQIVTYPYQIPDSLAVAKTHAQYYQLDMETDDIVVWYTLYDTNYKYYKTKNDVRNNYYIYNRGNVTYSGVGHDGGLTDAETKLFVNTMIAAYSAGMVATNPVIINKDRSSTGNNTDYLYIDYDATLDVGTAKPFGTEINAKVDGSGNTIYTKRIYYTLRNYSIVPNKKMTVHYYPVIVTTIGGVTTRKVLTEYPMPLDTYDFDPGIDTSSPGVTIPPLGTETFSFKQKHSDGNDYTDNITGSVVQSTYEYYVDVPISDIYYKNLVAGSTDPLENFALDSNSRLEIQLQVIMRYGRDTAAKVPLVGTRNAIFVKRGMFTLD